MATVSQTCSTSGCDNAAAYRTNKRPAFCRECIEKVFEAAGLELLEAFEKPDDYYFCRCLECGEEVHYRFNYLLDKEGRPKGARACRVCHWQDWYKWGRSIGAVRPENDLATTQAESAASACGADLVKVIPGEYVGESIYITKCRGCGLIQAERKPVNHEKCRPLKSSEKATLDIAPVSSTKGCAEEAYPVTDNQRRAAREFKPDNHLAFLSDLSWWDFEKNDKKQLFALTPESRKSVFALCAKCGESFESPVFKLFQARVSYYAGICPACEQARRDEWETQWQVYKTTTVLDYPELLACWDDPKDPSTAIIATSTLRKWKCPEGHHPSQTALSFLESGCMVCSGLASKERNAIESKNHRIPPFVPHELCDQWHPEKNSKFEYGKTHISEKRKVWWQCDHCGFEWEESVRDRLRLHEYGAWDAWHAPYCRCPECGGTLDSLAWHYPSLAREWSANNPVSAWDVRPNTNALSFTPQWVCLENPNHVWAMPLASRVRGAGCPECQDSSKSKTELAYFKEAKRIWPNAAVKSGVILRDEQFSRPWTADIFVAAAKPFIIEYDGAYWHKDKMETDIRKSLELLGAGYRLIRLREGALPSLGIEDPLYHEVSVLANGVDKGAVLEEISRLMEMKK